MSLAVRYYNAAYLTDQAPNMRIYWPQQGGDPQEPHLVFNRKVLVKRFNKVVGAPSANDVMFQIAFIAGKVPCEDAVLFARLVSYKVAMAPATAEE